MSNLITPQIHEGEMTKQAEPGEALIEPFDPLS